VVIITTEILKFIYRYSLKIKTGKISCFKRERAATLDYHVPLSWLAHRCRATTSKAAETASVLQESSLERREQQTLLVRVFGESCF